MFFQLIIVHSFITLLPSSPLLKAFLNFSFQMQILSTISILYAAFFMNHLQKINIFFVLGLTCLKKNPVVLSKKVLLRQF